jgi:hypothetical protein
VLVIVLGKVGVWYLLWALGGITMTNDRGLVGNFVDLCEFNGLDPEDGLSVVGRFMDVCKTSKVNPVQAARVAADFMDLCDTDPAEALEILNAQDWHADEECVTMTAGVKVYEGPEDELTGKL